MIYICSAFILGIIGIQYVKWRNRIHYYCPECGTESLTLVSKDPIETNIAHRHTGLEGRTDISMRYRLDFHCNECHHFWTDEIVDVS